MRIDETLLQILAVDCRLDGSADEVKLTTVDSVRAALNALRTADVDLLLTRGDVAGSPVWPLAERVRRVRPKLHWWLVAHGITVDQEILARTLGVTRILAAAPTAEAICRAFARPTPRPTLAARPAEPLPAGDVPAGA